MIVFLSSSALLLSIIGAVLNAKKHISGFYIWIASDILWMVYGAMIEEITLIINFFVFGLIAVYGIKNWGNKN